MNRVEGTRESGGFGGSPAIVRLIRDINTRGISDFAISPSKAGVKSEVDRKSDKRAPGSEAECGC